MGDGRLRDIEVLCDLAARQFSCSGDLLNHPKSNRIGQRFERADQLTIIHIEACLHQTVTRSYGLDRSAAVHSSATRLLRLLLTSCHVGPIAEQEEPAEKGSIP